MDSLPTFLPIPPDASQLYAGSYSPSWVIVSIVLVILASYASLSASRRLTHIHHPVAKFTWALISVFTLGIGIWAMAAFLPSTVFTPTTIAIIVSLATALLVLSVWAAEWVARNYKITEKLRDSEERWKFALDGAGDGVWDWNPHTDKAYFSKRWEEMLGYEKNEFPATGQAWVEHLHPDEKKRVLATVQAHFKDIESIFVIEFRMRCKDGSWKWILDRGKLVSRDAEGNPTRMIGTHTDITERKQLEEQLHIAAIAFESQEGMMVTDTQGVILRVNTAFTRGTGFSAADAVGQSTQMLRASHHTESFYAELWDTLRSTGGWQGEIWGRRKNGEEYPKWLVVSAVKDKEVTTHYVWTHYDITERKKAEEKINELAFFDQLTGLPNRILFLDRLKQAMTASSRDGSHNALLFLDMDNFKTLNETLGHEMGDLLLREVARRLTECVRVSDTVGRLGGDEFVLILIGLDMQGSAAAYDAEMCARKILSMLNQPYAIGNLAHQSTVSIGITLFNGHHTAVDDVLKQAELAMYKSKEAGRNTMNFFDPDMETAVMTRATRENDLRVAVREKQFMLYYQAQVIDHGRLTGAEVLLRWQQSDGSFVSPADFIPLAEETGLILPLGNWVLEEACRQLAIWAGDPDMADLTIAVNVSALQFSQKDFVTQVLTTLDITGANPKRLKLELTESLLVGNIQTTIEKMFALKARGVGFSLDDFGTGYSSLSYLKKLPLDQLKIDQSFVRDILNDPNDAAIAKTIVALAQSLGLGVIAEGVETMAQCDLLVELGCHAHQGYFFSRPVPLENFEALARSASLLPQSERKSGIVLAFDSTRSI